MKTIAVFRPKKYHGLQKMVKQSNKNWGKYLYLTELLTFSSYWGGIIPSKNGARTWILTQFFRRFICSSFKPRNQSASLSRVKINKKNLNRNLTLFVQFCHTPILHWLFIQYCACKVFFTFHDLLYTYLKTLQSRSISIFFHFVAISNTYCKKQPILLSILDYKQHDVHVPRVEAKSSLCSCWL